MNKILKLTNMKKKPQINKLSAPEFENLRILLVF
jgi:hypothetical protein